MHPAPNLHSLALLRPELFCAAGSAVRAAAAAAAAALFAFCFVFFLAFFFSFCCFFSPAVMLRFARDSFRSRSLRCSCSVFSQDRESSIYPCLHPNGF